MFMQQDKPHKKPSKRVHPRDRLRQPFALLGQDTSCNALGGDQVAQIPRHQAGPYRPLDSRPRGNDGVLIVYDVYQNRQIQALAQLDKAQAAMNNIVINCHSSSAFLHHRITQQRFRPGFVVFNNGVRVGLADVNTRCHQLQRRSQPGCVDGFVR